MPRKLCSQSKTLTAARQTMAAWSKVIESQSDIPEAYRSCFDKHIGNEQSFPHVILTPPLDKFSHKTTEKLICDIDHVIYIFERNGDRIVTSCYPYHEICEVELGVILLDSWLTIRGKTTQGEANVSTIEFNTASMRHFAPILKKLRSAPRIEEDAQFTAEKDKFSYLSEVNFKFMNYGRESLMPGETVLQILLQPEIREPRWSIFGKTFYKTISLAHLTILTDRDLILIRDTERNKASRLSRYGGIWQFIPLSCLESLNLSESAHQRLTLSIGSRSGKTIEKLFEISSQTELEQFCSQFQTLSKGVHTIV
jgi:hypothetical protein